MSSKERKPPHPRPAPRSPLDRPIAVVAPLLDLLLWAGDRLSRLTGPVDHEHYPVKDPDSDRDDR